VAGIPLPRDLRSSMTMLLVSSTFSEISIKKHHLIRKLLKQNKFARHCSKITDFLLSIEVKNFLSNTPSKKQGHI
jgi:hypothetical protein